MSHENAVYNLTSSSDLVTVRQDQPYHHQLPPYGVQGPPYIVAKHKLTYPELSFKLSWSMFERKRLEEQLNKCFPPIYVIAHSLCLIMHSLIMISLQIVLIVLRGALGDVAAGIWGGFVFLVIAAVTLYLVFTRKYWILIASYVLHIFGLLVAIGAYLVVNIIGIGLYANDCSIEPELACYNIEMKAISYIMFWLGVVLIVMVLVYLIFMPIYIMDVCHQRSKYRQQMDKANAMDEDFLQHSSLYAQNNLNADGTVHIQNILSVKTSRYDYTVSPHSPHSGRF